MIIAYQGEDSFKISQGDLSLNLNPKTKSSADITLFSNGRKETADKSGFVIDGPGEYEVKGVTLKGFLSEGPDGLINTIYLISFEGMNLCFLGSLANSALSTKILESLEAVDILFVPVGGDKVLDPSSAYKLAVSLEPSVIIPMLYDKSALDKFLKEGGEKEGSSLDKLVVKKKDLEGKSGEIVVLNKE